MSIHILKECVHRRTTKIKVPKHGFDIIEIDQLIVRYSGPQFNKSPGRGRQFLGLPFLPPVTNITNVTIICYQPPPPPPAPPPPPLPLPLPRLAEIIEWVEKESKHYLKLCFYLIIKLQYSSIVLKSLVPIR